MQKKICVVEFCPGGLSADIDFVEKKTAEGKTFSLVNLKQTVKLKVFFLVRTSQRHLGLASLI